eukprot:PITA_29586
MPLEESGRVGALLPFEIKSLQESFKYLGFLLKPDTYRVQDWKWLLIKIEKKLNFWSHKWLSQAGRLVLIKTVLIAIPVYWASLMWVTKGILASIDKLCSRFLWAGSKVEHVTPWVAWDKISRPKEWGGWAIKHLSFFSKSLAAKLAWRLISTNSLWSTVTKRKYIASATTMEWVRNPIKSSKNASVVANPRTTTIWRQGWLTEADLHLEERWREEWSLFVLDLQNSSVQISEARDELFWVHAQTGSYSPKTGYKWLMSQQGWEDPAWWSKLLWELKCPAKTRLFFSCILQKKVPTWDFLQKRGKIGPGWCSLCKANEESTTHLFLTCPFNVSLWAESLRLMNSPLRWEGDNIQQAWFWWWQEASDEKVLSIPLLIAWGTWLARNQVIFKDLPFLIGKRVVEGATIYDNIPSSSGHSIHRSIKTKFIRESVPWAYFDGVADLNGRCGAGLVIHITPKKSFHASIGLGQGTNNFTELKALHHLLCWLSLKQLRQVQIFGDSKNVVNWFNKTQHCRNYILLPLLNEILHIKSFFNEITICHIYRERNQEADNLSKTGVQQDLGIWSVTEMNKGVINPIDQPVFG